MGKGFLTPDFLLQNKTAVKLYHDYAEEMPIIDYHCHLPPSRIADNNKFRNLSEIWLGGDHYKWRAMRSNGVNEKYCTGDASDQEKFRAWAKTVPYTLRNPLYHWTHLELRDPFGITDKVLCPETADEIYEKCNEKLREDAFSPNGLLEHFKVKAVCTTDDPADNLEFHIQIKKSGKTGTAVFPTFRPDKAMKIENGPEFTEYLRKLGKSAGIEIRYFKDLVEALRKRQQFFHDNGCRISDHGLETVYSEDYTETEIDSILSKAFSEEFISAEEEKKFKSAVLFECGLMIAEKGWTMQLHLGAMRNNNTKMFETLGPDSGFDSIGDYPVAEPLSNFMDNLESRNSLPKTILYNLNPKDNEVLATMLGNFQDGSIPGKIQLGSGWWFLDQKNGMERQIDALSNLGLLSRFVGMLTDSRSFLSFPRHEYFRRILCNILGKDAEDGLIPKDMDLLGNMVKDICFNNAERYFDFPNG
ncbi:MAG: glucuronate isomerase [Fibrobacterota bacterium]